MDMDIVMLDKLTNIVKKDFNNTNEYKGFDKLMNTLSNKEVKYFIERCGDKLFHNDTLSLILWKTHPIIFNDFITGYIDNKVKVIDYDLARLELEFNKGGFTVEEYKKVTKSYLDAKTQITNLKNGFVSNIVHFLKNKE